MPERQKMNFEKLFSYSLDVFNMRLSVIMVMIKIETKILKIYTIKNIQKW